MNLMTDTLPPALDHIPRQAPDPSNPATDLNPSAPNPFPNPSSQPDPSTTGHPPLPLSIPPHSTLPGLDPSTTTTFPTLTTSTSGEGAEGGAEAPRKTTLQATRFSKSIIVCSDGTGRASTHGEEAVPTNVARFAQALEVSPEWWSGGSDRNGSGSGDRGDGTGSGQGNGGIGGEGVGEDGDEGRKMETQQVVLYQTGVGTGAGPIGEFFGEAFGHGLDIHVLEAYHFFVHNFEDGDRIYVFGFSRGAFAARAIASFIINVGLLKKEYLHFLPPIYREYKQHFRPKKRHLWNTWLTQNHALLEKITHKVVRIPVLGLWDTVGSLGIPETRFSAFFEKVGLPIRRWWNEKYAFLDSSITAVGGGAPHNLQIEHAFQALALDEHRISFGPTLLATPSTPQTPLEKSLSIERPEHYPIITQCWFPGVHTDIGGGYPRGPLDMSDFALAWMVDQCLPYLKFSDEFLARSFGEPSYGFVEGSRVLQREAMKPQQGGGELKRNRWGLARLNDSSRGLRWKIVGSRTRAPGEYYLGKKDGEGRVLRTNEYFHPSLRARLVENLRISEELKEGKGKKGKGKEGWEEYKPKAMRGFRVKRHYTPEDEAEGISPLGTDADPRSAFAGKTDANGNGNGNGKRRISDSPVEMKPSDSTTTAATLGHGPRHSTTTNATASGTVDGTGRPSVTFSDGTDVTHFDPSHPSHPQVACNDPHPWQLPSHSPNPHSTTSPGNADPDPTKGGYVYHKTVTLRQRDPSTGRKRDVTYTVAIPEFEIKTNTKTWLGQPYEKNRSARSEGWEVRLLDADSSGSGAGAGAGVGVGVAAAGVGEGNGKVGAETKARETVEDGSHEMEAKTNRALERIDATAKRGLFGLGAKKSGGGNKLVMKGEEQKEVVEEKA